MKPACEDADIIQRRRDEERAWAAAADRGCHKLPANERCGAPLCPVCTPLSFKQTYPAVAAITAPVEHMPEDDWPTLKQQARSAPAGVTWYLGTSMLLVGGSGSVKRLLP